MQCTIEGIQVYPEIMIPFVATLNEFEAIKEYVIEEIKAVFKQHQREFHFKIGTMIELPRACIIADQIAAKADFFSFGTNDLTQTTYGLSRDDSGKCLSEYVARGIMNSDPFVHIDEEGVGALVRMALEKGIKANPKLHTGICGEHGGDPQSVDFCHRIGLSYVSCSPFRVPVARLAAAQAALRSNH